jgi:hypothetical protein
VHRRIGSVEEVSAHAEHQHRRVAGSPGTA